MGQHLVRGQPSFSPEVCKREHIVQDIRESTTITFAVVAERTHQRPDERIPAVEVDRDVLLRSSPWEHHLAVMDLLAIEKGWCIYTVLAYRRRNPRKCKGAVGYLFVPVDHRYPQQYAVHDEITEEMERAWNRIRDDQKYYGAILRFADGDLKDVTERHTTFPPLFVRDWLPPTREPSPDPRARWFRTFLQLEANGSGEPLTNYPVQKCKRICYVLWMDIDEELKVVFKKCAFARMVHVHPA